MRSFCQKVKHQNSSESSHTEVTQPDFRISFNLSGMAGCITRKEEIRDSSSIGGEESAPPEEKPSDCDLAKTSTGKHDH